MHRARIVRSSTFRLALIYWALFGGSVLILLGFIYWSTVAYMGRQTDAIIDAEIAGLAERYNSDGLAGLTGLIAERLSRKPAGSSIYLLTDQSFHPLVGNLDRWPDVTASPDGWLTFQLKSLSAGNSKLHRARARAFDLAGGFHLLVGRDMRELEDTQELVIRTLAWGLGITLVLGLVGGSMMTRGMVRRIEAINATSREIMSGDLARRIPTKGTGDDFDELADNLNSMLDRIQALMEDVRRVSDNIAHDLRTPLARLRNRLEQLKLQMSASAAPRESIDAAITEADQLLSTFNALLRIARIESNGYRSGFKDVDLQALLADVVELYEPLAEDKSQRLTTHLAAGMRIRADRDLLFQAIANLLDNAIKYTPRGGSVELHLERTEGGGRIIVADSGPGIPAPAHDKVFQRFFRLDASRTTAGSGLGLSLVAAVARLHQMRITLSDNNPGLRVVVEFAGRGSTETRASGVSEPAGPCTVKNGANAAFMPLPGQLG